MSTTCIELDGVRIGTGPYLRIRDYCGAAPVISLSVSDAQDGPSVLQRIVRLTELRERHGSPSMLSVNCHSGSPETLGMVLGSVAAMWDGALSVNCHDAECLEKALPYLGGRKALVCGADASNIEGMVAASADNGCPLAVRAPDLEGLLDLADMAEGSGVGGLVLEPEIRNMKGCLETCTDIRRLAVEHSLSQAAHPVLVRTGSGEYAAAVSSVAILRYASLLVLDDLDEQSLAVLNELISAGQGLHERQ